MARGVGDPGGVAAHAHLLVTALRHLPHLGALAELHEGENVERDLEDTRPLIRPGRCPTWTPGRSPSPDATRIILRTDSGVYAKAAGDGGKRV